MTERSVVETAMAWFGLLRAGQTDEADLMHYWRFDEQGGTVAYDMKAGANATGVTSTRWEASSRRAASSRGTCPART